MQKEIKRRCFFTKMYKKTLFMQKKNLVYRFFIF
jgi:hypothetical protein